MHLASNLPNPCIRALHPGANVCPGGEVMVMLDKRKEAEGAPWAARIVIELIRLMIVLLCGSGPR